MTTYKDLADLWGAERVHRLSASAFDRLDLPVELRMALCEVGLPETDHQEFVPHLKGNGLILPEFHPAGRRDRWYRLGRNRFKEVCVQSSTGEVWTMDPTDPTGDCFVNSSVNAFIDFLYLQGRFKQQASRVSSDEEAFTLLLHAKTEMRRRDPRAFGDAGTYWSQFIEEGKNMLR